MATAFLSTPPAAKPRLRGVSHEIACYASALAGVYLVSQARGDALVGTTIYSLSLFALFTASALYHRPNWSKDARAVMRRVDHAAIYLLIAGTASAVALLSLQGGARQAMLITTWIGATLGIAKSLLWIHAPKVVATLSYLLIAFASAPFIPRISAAMGSHAVALILIGAALYVAGAVVYALRRPNPFPTVFGYHEIFHALVIAAAACHFTAILKMVQAAQ